MSQANPFTRRHLKLDKAKRMKNAVEKISRVTAITLELNVSVQRQRVLSGLANPKPGDVSFTLPPSPSAIDQPLHPLDMQHLHSTQLEPGDHDSPLDIVRKP